MPKARDSRVTRGGGNVFDDLGFPNAEDHRAKAELVSELKRIIDREGWTQAQAAKTMGMAQPDVSRLLKGPVLELLDRPDHALPEGGRLRSRDCHPAQK